MNKITIYSLLAIACMTAQTLAMDNNKALRSCAIPDKLYEEILEIKNENARLLHENIENIEKTKKQCADQNLSVDDQTIANNRLIKLTDIRTRLLKNKAESSKLMQSMYNIKRYLNFED
jgi:hypothetical protein